MERKILNMDHVKHPCSYVINMSSLAAPEAFCAKRFSLFARRFFLSNDLVISNLTVPPVFLPKALKSVVSLTAVSGVSDVAVAVLPPVGDRGGDRVGVRVGDRGGDRGGVRSKSCVIAAAGGGGGAVAVLPPVGVRGGARPLSPGRGAGVFCFQNSSVYRIPYCNLLSDLRKSAGWNIAFRAKHPSSCERRRRLDVVRMINRRALTCRTRRWAAPKCSPKPGRTGYMEVGMRIMWNSRRGTFSLPQAGCLTTVCSNFIPRPSRSFFMQ